MNPSKLQAEVKFEPIVLKLLFPALSIHPTFLSEVRISFAIPWAGLPVILYALQL